MAAFEAAAGGPVPRYRVACSGGADSVALLHALAALPRLRGRLAAVHVDHGLHPDSGHWATCCARLCEDLDVPLETCRLDGGPGPGESVEAWAREGRYAWLAALTGPGECVLTAHHQDDQAETVLLQLLRGAGPHGLAGVAPRQVLGRGWLWRPLLPLPRARLRAFAAARAVPWLEDPANLDPRYDRNFLRHALLPLIERRWPGARATLSRAAALQGEAAGWMDRLCDSRLGPANGPLALARLRDRPPEERRWLLRRWVQRAGLPLPQSRHLRELERLLQAGSGGGRVHWPGAEVRRHGPLLHAMAPLGPAPAAGLRLDWPDADSLPTAWGRLSRHGARGEGLARARCAGRRWELRFREGGERCRPAGRGGRSAPLKKVLQEMGLPVWQRQRLPLLYLDGELAAVGDSIYCLPFAAAPGEPSVRLSWEPSPPP